MDSWSRYIEEITAVSNLDNALQRLRNKCEATPGMEDLPERALFHLFMHHVKDIYLSFELGINKIEKKLNSQPENKGDI